MERQDGCDMLAPTPVTIFITEGNNRSHSYVDYSHAISRKVECIPDNKWIHELFIFHLTYDKTTYCDNKNISCILLYSLLFD